MHIGNRNFPYPLLNHNKNITDYRLETDFRLVFDINADGKLVIENKKICFRNIHFELTDPDLRKMVEEKKLQGAFLVQCSRSVYRKCFPITQQPENLEVDMRNFSGDVNISAFLYAIEDIDNFSSEGFNPRYTGYSCKIDKYDIVAVDEGLKFSIDVEPTDAKDVSSIFLLVPKEDDDQITYQDGTRKIIIYLPRKQYEAYRNIKNDRRNENIAFAMIAIPVLTACIKDAQKELQNTDLEDLAENKKWLYSVAYRYKEVTGQNLTGEELVNIGALQLAQLVLNNAICNGLSDFESILFEQMKSDGDEDE